MSWIIYYSNNYNIYYNNKYIAEFWLEILEIIK
jgi:hypothetical protein